jgi:hypothetical protein
MLRKSKGLTIPQVSSLHERRFWVSRTLQVTLLWIGLGPDLKSDHRWRIDWLAIWADSQLSRSLEGREDSHLQLVLSLDLLLSSPTVHFPIRGC